MWTVREQLKALLMIVLLTVTVVVLIGAVAEKKECEAKGGKRLRGTWAWEGFQCYDLRTLKVLP